MKASIFARRLSLSLLLLSAAAPAFAAGPSAAPAATTLADNPALHPTFTVRVVGKGQPMLLIPGLNCTGAVWDEAVAHFQQRFQCHIITLAGFGATAPVAVPDPLLPAVRDQLLAYIKSQKLNKPVIVGHSLGGFMALALSAAQPGAIGPLVIVDSLPFLAAVQNPAATVETVKPQATTLRTQMSRGHLSRAAQREMAAGMVTDTARITQVVRWGVASDPATAAQAMYDLYTTDLRPDLGRIRQPVLVLGAWTAYAPYGATKQSIRAVFAQQYARLTGVRIEMSEAGSHFLMYDDPQWFLAQADAFLKQPALAKK